MSDEPVDINGDEEKHAADDNWENRKLCSDESCIGVIGADGRCKECGRPYEQQPAEDEAHSAKPSEDQQMDESSDAAPAASDSDDDWENRTLCSDESCIGVIGSDGRCKECGKPYAG